MLGLMQRNIVELQSGTQKQVDTFNALGLSLSDLQGLSPDEQFSKIAASLDSITDPAEKTAAAMEVFGRSGRDAINMLNGYGAAAANAEAFQRRFGIAVSQDVSDNVERANDAVGRLGMVFTGLGNQMAGILAPAVERTANMFIEFAGKIFGARQSLEEFFGTLERARQSLGEDVFNRLVGNPTEIMDVAPAIDAVAESIEGVVLSGIQVMAQNAQVTASFQRLKNTDAVEFMKSMDSAMRDLIDQFTAGEISAEEFADRMASLERETRDAIAAFGDVNDVKFSGAITALDVLRNKVNEVIDAGIAMRAAMDGPVSFQAGPTGRRGHRAGTAITSSLRPQSRPEDIDFGFPSVTSTSGGGGGTDPNEVLREQMATRLETLMESLMTEREAVANWYAEGLELIQNSSDAELEAIGGKQEAIERLEKEHQARLSRIRELGAASDLATVLGAGNEILTAIGQNNEKALRIAKAFGAAEALISAYQGAANALKLPFPKNIAAAATVLAKGIGFVNAIKGVSKGGGSAGASAGGGGAGAAAVAEAPQQQVQSLNFTVMSDPFGIGERVVRQIASQLNEAQRNGNTLIRANVV
jgi:hypothetical protein